MFAHSQNHFQQSMRHQAIGTSPLSLGFEAYAPLVETKRTSVNSLGRFVDLTFDRSSSTLLAADSLPFTGGNGKEDEI